MPPRVDVLLLNWNRSSDTIECLESVMALDYPNFGVVVCDNASTDDSISRIEAWAEGTLTVQPVFRGALRPRCRSPRAPISYVRYDRAEAEAGGDADARDPSLVIIQTGGNLGFAGGNNVGLRYVLARGDADYVWLLNNDAVVSPSALRALVDRAERDRRIGAVGGTLLEFHQPDVVQYKTVANYSPWHGMVTVSGWGDPASARRTEPRRFDFVSGACILVRTAALARVGLLDERFFMYGEDIDWSVRMRRERFQLAYAPDAEVWHKGSASSVAQSPMHDYHNVKGSLMVVLKHHPWRVPVALVYSVYRCLLPKIVRRQWGRFAAVARAYGDIVRAIARASALPPPVRAAMPCEPSVPTSSSSAST